MRDLPDHASVDHLRRQAKDQLVVLRRTEPDATLTDAQASVAQQYGFPSWADLKAEAERRAAAPPRVAEDEVTRQLASAFGLGPASGPMTHVERGWTGETWDLATAEGRWVVTSLADYVVAEDIETEADLVERSIAAGILAPEPVRTAAGPFVLDLDGTNWRVHRWVTLGPPLPQPPAPDDAAEGGRILARIHELGLEPPKPVVPWLTQRWPEAQWRQLADAAHTDGRVWADAFDQAIPRFLELDDAVADPRDPNERAILSKAWHAPAAMRSAGANGLLATGWEHASAIPKDWDLGASIMAWAETDRNDFDVTVARSFVDGYRSVVGDVPIDLPMFTSGVTGALNWAISRANIALNDDDPTERELAERNIRVLVDNPITPDAVVGLADALR